MANSQSEARLARLATLVPQLSIAYLRLRGEPAKALQPAGRRGMSTQAPSKKRVLIVADAKIARGRDAFPADIQDLMEQTSEALMIAPALTSRLQWLATDIGQARARAQERLQGILA